jgi:hypothetical protein
MHSCPDLLYSVSSPKPLIKYSVLHNGISSKLLGSIKNVYLSDEIRIQLKLSPLFSCILHVVHISPTRTGELTVTTSRASRGWKVYTRRGAARCPKGLSPPQCHAAFGTMLHTLASVDQSPVCHPRTFPPSATRTPRLNFGGDMHS